MRAPIIAAGRVMLKAWQSNIAGSPDSATSLGRDEAIDEIHAVDSGHAHAIADAAVVRCLLHIAILQQPPPPAQHSILVSTLRKNKANSVRQQASVSVPLSKERREGWSELAGSVPGVAGGQCRQAEGLQDTCGSMPNPDPNPSPTLNPKYATGAAGERQKGVPAPPRSSRPRLHRHHAARSGSSGCSAS
jgi:hypothetical protein